MIVSNIAYVSDKQNIIASFNGTASAVARYNNVPEELIRQALRRMLDEGLLVQKEQRVEFNRKVKVIRANREALVAAGLWSYDNG